MGGKRRDKSFWVSAKDARCTKRSGHAPAPPNPWVSVKKKSTGSKEHKEKRTVVTTRTRKKGQVSTMRVK